MSIQKTLANNMRKYRKAAHLSQEKLAEKAGLHRTYIGGIEQTRINVSMKNLEKIASALDVNPATLLMDDPVDGPMAQPASLADGTPLLPGDYAFCECTDDGMEFYPLNVKDEDLTIHILTALVAQGHAGENLVSEYHRAQDALLEYFSQKDW